MSDRVAVMNHGRIQQVGTPAEIYERPRTRFVAGFVGQTNLIRGTMGDTRYGLAEVTVEGIGILRAAPPVGTRPGKDEHVSVAIRPERVTIGHADGGPGPFNTITGTVVELIYRGSHSQMVVESAGGVRLIANIPAAPGAAPAPSSGQTVELAFACSDASVLLDDEPDQSSGS
jgi:ABC-type Fe3+/spermidine/putrescine transport system ATPase subunit